MTQVSDLHSSCSCHRQLGTTVTVHINIDDWWPSSAHVEAAK